MRALDWGQSPSGQCQYANGADAVALASIPEWRTAACSDGHPETSPVSSHEPNAVGLYDAWASFGSGPATARTSGMRAGRSTGANGNPAIAPPRVQRGGGWANEPEALRSASRSRVPVGERYETAGLRVARSVAPGPSRILHPGTPTLRYHASRERREKHVHGLRQ